MAKYRLLVVDDDDDTRRMLNLALNARYEVIEACDGLEALSKLEAYEPDFAILDVMMPMMDGYQLCEAIRKNPRFSTIHVMFLSAYSSRENIKKGYAVGANLFMTKPVDPERILKNLDFTIQHDPPPLRHKKYTLAELAELDRQRKPAPAAPAHGAHGEPTARAQGPTTHAARQVAGQHAANAAHSAHAAAPGAKIRLLVVDDDPEMLEMADLALRDEFEVTTALNGIDAIERMVDYEPDIMLVDIMMPKMNGYQLLQSVRRNAYMQNMPVVVISAKSTARDKEYAERLGATRFLAKPYRIEELLRLLRELAAAPGFRVKPKRLTMDLIRQRIAGEGEDREARDKLLKRQQQFDQLRHLANDGRRGHEG